MALDFREDSEGAEENNRKWLELVKERVGYAHYCVCRQCLKKLMIDLDKDEIKCTSCGSNHIVSALDLVGNICPKCKDGVFEAIDTGFIC